MAEIQTPVNPITEAFAAELRARKAVARISWVDLASNTGISKSTLQRVFDAKRELQATHLVMIAGVLGVPVTDIVTSALQRVPEEFR